MTFVFNAFSATQLKMMSYLYYNIREQFPASNPTDDIDIKDAPEPNEDSFKERFIGPEIPRVSSLAEIYS